MDSSKKYPKTNITQHKPRESAYVIPYLQNEKGEIQVLVGQKKVIYYPTQLELETQQNLGRWKQLANSVSQGKFDPGRDSRFNGLFFYGAGRPTFLGGRAEPNEDIKHAAAREFLEESGIDRQIKDEKEKELLRTEIMAHLQPVYYTERFKGNYFSLDVNKVEKLKNYLTPDKIDLENKRILDEEEKIKLPLKQRNVEPDKVSELHEIKWVPLDKFMNYINSNEHDEPFDSYIKKEMARGAGLINSYLAQGNKTYYNKGYNFLNDRLRGQSLLDNVEAAALLTNKLSPELFEKNPQKMQLSYLFKSQQKTEPLPQDSKTSESRFKK